MSLWQLLQQNQGGTIPDRYKIGLYGTSQIDGSMSPDDIPTTILAFVNTSVAPPLSEFALVKATIKKFGCLMNFSFQAITIPIITANSANWVLYNTNGGVPTVPYVLPPDALPLAATQPFIGPPHGEDQVLFSVPIIFDFGGLASQGIAGIIVQGQGVTAGQIFLVNLSNALAPFIWGPPAYSFGVGSTPIHSFGGISLNWSTAA